MKTTWTVNYLPETPGRFWLWCKRWENDPIEKLYIAEAMEVSNGYAYTCEGGFLWESELTGDYYTTPTIEPDWPNSPNSIIIE